ncbi:aspartate kinase, partial [Candidatus Micrarchaeota archaeon CG11_big_fil_rev_8_21_14_0_20_47_5]
AMGKTTDDLMQLVEETHPNGENGNKENIDDILAMGERTSIRIFCSVLQS